MYPEYALRISSCLAGVQQHPLASAYAAAVGAVQQVCDLRTLSLEHWHTFQTWELLGFETHFRVMCCCCRTAVEAAPLSFQLLSSAQ